MAQMVNRVQTPSGLSFIDGYDAIADTIFYIRHTASQSLLIRDVSYQILLQIFSVVTTPRIRLLFVV